MEFIQKGGMVKILYVTGRWDPRTQNEYSGNDFGAYQALLNQPDFQVHLVGPLDFQPNLPERTAMRLYGQFSKKRLIKYPLSYI